MPFRNTNRRPRQRSASQLARIANLEEMLVPPEPPESRGLDWAVRFWAWHFGGHPSELADQLQRLCDDDLLHFMTRDDVCGRYTPGNMPATGSWDFTEEQRLECDEIMARINAVERELLLLWQAAGSPTLEQTQARLP